MTHLDHTDSEAGRGKSYAELTQGSEAKRNADKAVGLWYRRWLRASALNRELLEALEAILKVRVEGHDNIWAGADRCKAIARDAIAKARGAA